jgi:hypothetical protein
MVLVTSSFGSNFRMAKSYLTQIGIALGFYQP